MYTRNAVSSGGGLSGTKTMDARSGLEIGTTFAAAFERDTPRACPSATVRRSEPLASSLGDTPLRLVGFFGGKWSADRLREVLNKEEEVVMHMSWHAAADARSVSNGSIVSPAVRNLKLHEGLRLLHLGVSARGLPAYIRQSALEQQPGLRNLEPVARALQHAGSKLHKAGMWLGDASMISTLHHDDYHNILVQLGGTKRVLLLPPSAQPQLDLRTYDEERWEYSPSRDKLSDFPVKTFRRIDNFYHLDVFNGSVASNAVLADLAPRGLLCDLSAGEALYIPYPWAHAVLSTNDANKFGLNLAVNVWWETNDQHFRKKLVQYGCTALAVVFYVLSMRPQLLNALNPWAKRSAAVGGAGARDASNEAGARTAGDGKALGGKHKGKQKHGKGGRS